MFKLAGVEKNNDAQKSKERRSNHTDKPAEVPRAENFNREGEEFA